MLSAPHALVQSMAWPRACECGVTELGAAI